jgi:putative ABC transport system substrate-binding protein
MAGREAEYPAVLDSLGGNVDVVVVYGDVGIAAARRMSDTTSVVFVNASEPVALGVVHSFARPGGNMTGISYMANELTGKRLELLREMLPRVSRIAVLVNPNNPAAPLDVHEVEAAGRALGVIVKRFDAPRPESFDGVITQIAQEGFGGVVVGADGMLYTHREKLRAPIASHRLPDSYAFREFVQVGGLLAYGANLTHLAARAAGYVARLLSGDKPANLPVERPTKIELAINLKTAKALGVTVPPALLLWADEVIE